MKNKRANPRYTLYQGEEHMQYFIGIVPPDEVKSRIIKFQTRWENNSLLQVVEPHITVKAQGGLTSDKNWVSTVEKICKDIPSFKNNTRQA